MIVVAGAVGGTASALGAPGGLVGVAGFLGSSRRRRSDAPVAQGVVVVLWAHQARADRSRAGWLASWDVASRAVMARARISLVPSASFSDRSSSSLLLELFPDPYE